MIIAVQHLEQGDACTMAPFFEAKKENSGLPGFGCIRVRKTHPAGQAFGLAIPVSTARRSLWRTPKFP